jgi:hypothetical protein
MKMNTTLERKNTFLYPNIQRKRILLVIDTSISRHSLDVGLAVVKRKIFFLERMDG